MKRSNIIGIIAAAVVIIVSVVLISWYLRKTTPMLIQGTVECTTYKASSKVPGRIDDMKVSQGDRVEKGQLLYTLSTPELEAKLQQAEAVKSAAAALDQAALAGARIQQIEAALNRGDVLRTHLLRPTWHFVSSKDLRWMLSLTADRIRAANDSYARGTDAALDSKSIHRYMNLLQKTLEGNKHRTKEEIGEALNQRGIPLSQYALRHLLMRAETDGIVCSGADKKGTATYALLDERAPHGEEPSREEALARLARIYFRSHSPATLADFTWWSGLTATEARRAVASIAEELTTEHFGDREFFVFRNAAAAAPCDTTHLLPAYDQYLIGYKDRSGVLAKEHTSKAFNSHGIFQPVILCDGQIVGNWKRTAGRGNVTIQTTLWVDTVPEALDAAIARYRSFIGGTKSENSPEAL